MSQAFSRAAASVAALFLFGSCATPPAPPAPAGPAASLAPAYQPARAQGYLTETTAPRGVQFLPAPPALDSGQGRDEVATFARTRALEGSSRWAMATADAAVDVGMVRRFACALGADPTAERVPALYRLLSRLRRDQSVVTNAAKDAFRRQRPFLGVPGSHICVPRDHDLETSFSYPSGHSTLGWSVALVLAELAPERATEIAARGRAYGDSRVVCGVHWPSDVMAGRVLASALVARQHAEPAFRADLDAARVEVTALRADPAAATDAGACASEAAVLAAPL